MRYRAERVLITHGDRWEQELGVARGQSPGLEALGLCSPAQEGHAEKDIWCQTQAWFGLSRFSDLLGKQHRRKG